MLCPFVTNIFNCPSCNTKLTTKAHRIRVLVHIMPCGPFRVDYTHSQKLIALEFGLLRLGIVGVIVGEHLILDVYIYIYMG